MMWLPSIVMIIAIAASVITDVRRGKIYNVVTAPAAALGLIANVIVHWTAGHPLAGLTESLLGIAVGFAVFFLSALLGKVLGGGDVKLLMVVGACNGPVFLLWTIVFMGLIGGAIAIGIALWQRQLIASIKRLIASLSMRVLAKTPMDASSEAKSSARLPYAVPIGIGGIVAFCVFQLPQFGIQLIH